MRCLLVGILGTGDRRIRVEQPDVFVQRVHHGRLERVVLAVLLELDESGTDQLGTLSERVVVAIEDIRAEFHQREPPERGGDPGETLLDHIGTEPYGLDDLGSLVGVERRDAHLAHHFEDSVLHRRNEVLLRTLRSHISTQATGDGQVTQ